jgi:hypothetical protein
MLSSEANKLAALAGLYALYLLVFVAFGPAVMGVWFEVAASTLACLLAARAAQRTRQGHGVFFTLLAASAFWDVLNLLTLRRAWTVPATAWSDLVGSNEVPLSFLFFGLFLFFWCCAWTYLLLRLLRSGRGGSVYLVAATVLVGLVVLYAESYRGFNMNILDAQDRFSTLFFGLELVGLLIGLVCILIGLSRPFVLLAVGFSIFAATDIVQIDLRLRGLDASSVELDPMWVLGRLLILAGLLVVPRLRAAGGGTVRAGSGAARQRSALSAVLLVFSLGSVFVVVAASQIITERHWFAMFFVLFCVVSVLAMSVITARFDEAVRYSRIWLRRLFSRRLEPDDWKHGRGRITRTLRLTSLDHVLASTAEAAERLSDEVVFLGPERLNRPGGRPRKGLMPTAFVVMPFGASWSDDVASLIRHACKEHGVHAVRGDDIFTPTDILDDIWRGILDADFVVADITGRNTNVFYELGMAHAIGKPVLILSQSPDDVPIDVKTRRILMYDSTDLAALGRSIGTAVAEVLRQYKLGASAR